MGKQFPTTEIKGLASQAGGDENQGRLKQQT
jgi:hypothetical protein